MSATSPPPNKKKNLCCWVHFYAGSYNLPKMPQNVSQVHDIISHTNSNISHISHYSNIIRVSCREYLTRSTEHIEREGMIRIMCPHKIDMNIHVCVGGAYFFFFFCNDYNMSDFQWQNMRNFQLKFHTWITLFKKSRLNLCTVAQLRINHFIPGEITIL